MGPRPTKLSQALVGDIELDLDALERGTKIITPDEDGDSRLGWAVG